MGLRAGPGLALKKVSRGLATADYDNDGDLEFLVSNMNGAPDLIRHARKSPNHSVLLKLTGTRGNRDAIGAKVRISAGGLTQVDEVRSGSSYLSSSDLRLHFGLGAAAKIDRIEIAWPSGQKDVVEEAPADHVLILREGAGLAGSTPFRKPAATPGPRTKG